MTPNEALEVADEVLFAHTGKHLTDLQRMILQESWADKSYMDMLDQGWALPTIRKAGNELWNLLSGALGEKVGKTSFRGALEKRLRAGDIVPKPPMQSSYNEQTWVGREALITDLLSKLQGQTRLLWITGISGIGKTTLGECLASQAWESDPAFHWYLEILEGQSPDFPSVAANLLDRIGDRDLDPQERNNSEQLARRLLQRLQSHRYWIQIDALEQLFNSEHPTEFVDLYWVTFLQRCLTNSAFASRLVLTSQAFPNALVEFNDRYPNVWTEIRLDGLLQVEQQLEFFAKRGIAVDAANRDILTQIAKTYEGHPLVLKVIAEDILKNFVGDVDRYWQVNQTEFEQVARELQAARLDETEYNEALDRKVRERIKKSLEQLPADALNLLCRSAVFRRPVPKTFWLAMMVECTPQQQKAAYYVLGDRALIEQEGIHQNQHLIRQHNLIRDIAYNLLRENTPVWETAERKAAELWLTEYEPASEVENLEKVRGYLEAFYHYCELGYWDAAKQILLDQSIGLWLQNWSYYKEMLVLHSRLIGHVTGNDDVICRAAIGNAFCFLGNYRKAINHWQQSLLLIRNVGNRTKEEGDILGNLGGAYEGLGEYECAMDFHQEHLAIAHNSGDQTGEARALGNLGNVYYSLGNYRKAVEYHQRCLTVFLNIENYQQETGQALCNLGNAQHRLGDYEGAIDSNQKCLVIAQAVDNPRGEAAALGNLGNAYYALGNYSKAMELQSQKLVLVREIGDRQGEGDALGSLGIIYKSLSDRKQAEYWQAIDYYQQHLVIAREIGDRQGEAIILGNLGEVYFTLKNYSKAVKFQKQSLVIAREIGARGTESYALTGLGEVLTKLEEWAEALKALQSALMLCKDTEERYLEAEVLKNLAKLHQKTGKIDLSREYCDRALALANELGIPLVKECETLKQQLEEEQNGGNC